MLETGKTELNLDQELEIIKCQLRNIEFLQSIENPLDASTYSELSESHMIVSPMNQSLIDEKLKENLQPKINEENLNDLKIELSLKDELIKSLKQEQEILIQQLDQSNSKSLQLEVDLSYCIEQNNLAFEEVKNLRHLLSLQQIDEVSINMEENSVNSEYFDIKSLKNHSNRLEQELKEMEEENDKLIKNARELEIKNTELTKEVNLMRNNINFTVNQAHRNNGQQGSIDLQRLIASALEKENKALKDENNYLKKKTHKISSGSNYSEKNVIKDLLSELKLASDKELYKRVLYLNEYYYQNKETRPFVQKLIQFVSRRTGNSNTSLSDVLNYILTSI